uniref:Uncharacterized protein n=1 Tax=Setaria viridis TaxID=4556 RepID=A0A4U6SR80_SETVI|nr:hypothetical protein SEVIR_9G018950v2 [Setaria viridis]
MICHSSIICFCSVLYCCGHDCLIVRFCCCVVVL